MMTTTLQNDLYGAGTSITELWTSPPPPPPHKQAPTKVTTSKGIHSLLRNTTDSVFATDRTRPHKSSDWSLKRSQSITNATAVKRKHPATSQQAEFPTKMKNKFVMRGPNISRNNDKIDPLQMHAKMNSFYRDIPLEFRPTQHTNVLGSTTATKQWNLPDSPLPQWMKGYLNWHHYKRQAWGPQSLGKERFLVVQCLKTDRTCGGTSDRLKPILYLLRLAYYSKRILIVHWTKPHPLTEFLVPPQGGIDWRAPPWLVQYIETLGLGETSGKSGENVLELVMDRIKLARSSMQDYHAGRYWYDEQLLPSEPNFETIFHHVWKIFFTPAPAVRKRLELTMSEMGLVPYNYTAAHCRVLYAKDDRPHQQQKNWAENAVNCASELRPKMTIFFTSDSANATKYAKDYGIARNANVQTRIPDPNPPLHIEFGGRRRPASDYVDGFVDLYIMAEATCVTYNKGGYGLLGLLMSRNATCGLRQDAIDRPKIHNPCHWVDDDPWNSTNGNTRYHYVPRETLSNHAPIYLAPVDD
jgi:hypothetical protein